MNASLMKRLFKAINETNEKTLNEVALLIIREEKKIGHERLALQLDSILTSANDRIKPALVQNDNSSSLSERKALTSLPTDRRYNQPLASLVPRTELEHHMVLSSQLEKRFRVIESEFMARERLAKFGLTHRRKVLLYGPPGCGKTLGAQRLAWNTGLPLLKVRFDSIISSYLGESASNLRTLFDSATQSPCVLLLDEFYFIARSRDNSQDVGEIPRIVNTLLQLLDEYKGSGIVVATTNLQGALDKALFRRFDDAFELPKPGVEQIEKLVKMSLSLLKVSQHIDWNLITSHLEGFSAAEIVKISENAAKQSVMLGHEAVTQENLLDVISETENYENMGRV